MAGAIEDIDFLLAKFLDGNSFHLNERAEVDLQVEFLREFQVRGVCISREFLGNQDTLDLSHPVSSNFTHINT